MFIFEALPAQYNLPQARTFPTHLPIKAPSMNGVSMVNIIELVGRFPSKTFRKHPGTAPLVVIPKSSEGKPTPPQKQG